MRLPRRGFSRTDWIGDGVVTLALGGAFAAGVFLPWANVSSGHDVNLSPHAARGVNAALATPWGAPVLALALAVVAVGAVMMLVRPSRLAALPCLGVALAGLAITHVCFAAGGYVWDPLRPGLGLFIDTLGGVLLVPTGLAAAMVALVLGSPRIMARVEARRALRDRLPE